MKFKPNDNIAVRTHRQLIAGTILNQFLRGYYVSYKMRIHTEGIGHYTRLEARWLPFWRIYKVEANREPENKEEK